MNKSSIIMVGNKPTIIDKYMIYSEGLEFDYPENAKRKFNYPIIERDRKQNWLISDVELITSEELIIDIDGSEDTKINYNLVSVKNIYPDNAKRHKIIPWVEIHINDKNEIRYIDYNKWERRLEK